MVNNNLKHARAITMVLSVLSVVFLSVLVASPFMSPLVNAEEVYFRTRVGSTIAITTSGDANITVSPTADGTYSEQDINVDISTNNATGYTATISSTDTETSLVGSTGNNTKIPTITQDNIGLGDFPVNHYGYSIKADTITFKGVKAPASADVIKVTSSPANADRTTITIATKLDATIPADTYTNTLLISAVTDYVEPTPPNPFNIVYMQDMTPETCAAVTTPSKTATALDTDGSHAGDTSYVPQATLIDSRDGNTYTVRKLADGNCWMSQNLRLKLTANTPLTSADTDVTSNFTPTLSTQPTSENATSWGSVSTASDVNKSRSYDTGNTNYGVYYNWYTATAGTGTYDMASGNATDSICPKGWQLPQYTGTKSYYNLITTTYGLASSAEGSTKLQSAPLSFPLSGYYYLTGSVANLGSAGHFWSATPHSSAYYAYYLRFDGSDIYLQNDTNKSFGHSVRCVARDDPKPNDISELTQALANAGAELEEAADGKMYYKMQAMNSDICNAIATPDKSVTSVPEATMIDVRDKELYTVRKLADGNCWMAQNLRLKLTANQALTSVDTDVSSSFTPTLSTQPTSENTTSWGEYNNASDVNKSRSYDTGNRDYGTYYNWYTATAGTGTYNMTSGNATGSICPKNWQLPLNDGTKSYYNLIITTYDLAGSTALRSAPLSFPLPGLYLYLGSVRNQGSHGYFWSAAPYSSAYRAYLLYFNSSNIYSQNYSDKASGLSVRCVVR